MSHRLWFQHEGDTAHYMTDFWECLKSTYPGRRIWCKGSVRHPQSMDLNLTNCFLWGSLEVHICNSSKDYQTFNGKTSDSCDNGQCPHNKVFLIFIYSVHIDWIELFIYDTHQCTSDIHKYNHISLLTFRHRLHHPQGALHQDLKLTKTQNTTKVIHFTLQYSVPLHGTPYTW